MIMRSEELIPVITISWIKDTMRFKFHLLLSLLVFCSTSILAEAQDIINPSYKRGFAGLIEAGVLFNKGFVGEYSSISGESALN